MKVKWQITFSPRKRLYLPNQEQLQMTIFIIYYRIPLFMFNVNNKRKEEFSSMGICIGGCYTSHVHLDYRRGTNTWYFDTIRAFPVTLARMEGDYQKLLVRKHKNKKGNLWFCNSSNSSLARRHSSKIIKGKSVKSCSILLYLHENMSCK